MKFSLVSAAAAAAFLVTLTAAEVVVWDGHGFQGDHVNCAWGCGDGQICPFDYRLDGRQRSIRSVDGNRRYHVWNQDGSYCRCVDGGGFSDIDSWPSMRWCKQVGTGACSSIYC